MTSKPFRKLLFTAFLFFCLFADSQTKTEKIMQQEFKEGTFGYDLAFLKKFDDVIILKSGEGAQVVVSPKYQAKVITSTATGNAGLSFGWVNYKAFNAAADPHMNAYGGENRLWLGPEGGKFSLFFKQASGMVFENWKTPAPFDTESWTVKSTGSDVVTLQKDMLLRNYQGTELSLSVDRTIKVLNRDVINKIAGVAAGEGVRSVAYETINVVTNKGSNEWTESSGMPCVWLLDMFKPSPQTVIVVPYKNEGGVPLEQVATTNYFGEISPARLKHSNNILYFKADGKSRGKLGVLPGSAKPVAGSYDIQNKILTVIVFDVDPTAKYLNQEWNTTREAFSGDAINAYNDGPLEDGSQMGPFYELESVSPAAFLRPGQSLIHKHAVYHFTGSESELDRIAGRMLGVKISDIKKAF
jgi:hypothetical protein